MNEQERPGARYTNTRPAVLRSIADSIRILFPDAADELCGIARSLERPLRPEDLDD